MLYERPSLFATSVYASGWTIQRSDSLSSTSIARFLPKNILLQLSSTLKRVKQQQNVPPTQYPDMSSPTPKVTAPTHRDFRKTVARWNTKPLAGNLAPIEGALHLRMVTTSVFSRCSAHKICVLILQTLSSEFDSSAE